MKNILFLFLFSCSVSMGLGQDIHFSQFYNSPLTINPALAGQKDANYRVNLNYRGQWQSIEGSRGITTFATSADGRVAEDLISKYDKLGVGLQAFYDSAGDGYYNTTTIAPTVAYHKALGYNHKLSVGFQPSYGNVGIDLSQLYFESQYIGIAFDRSLPTGENLVANSVSYFDLNAGALYSFRSSDDSWNAFLGGSMFHLNQPEINFLDGSVYNRPVRTVLNGGATVELGNNLLVSPSALWMTQAGAEELNVGVLFGKQIGNPYLVGDTKSIYGGAFWRQGDALIGKLGLQWNSMQLGMSGDFPVSDISDPLGFNSAFELSFTIIGLPDSDTKPIYCPTF